MTNINDLPCELVAAILRMVDSFATLQNAVLSCKHAYKSFKAYRDIWVGCGVAHHDIPAALLPFSVALLDANDREAWRQGVLRWAYELPTSVWLGEDGRDGGPTDEQSIYSIRRLFRNQYDDDEEEFNDRRTLRYGDEEINARRIEETRVLFDTLFSDPGKLSARAAAMTPHQMQEMVNTHQIVHDLACLFATEAWKRLHPQETLVGLSPAEYFHFCRAFYRVELFYRMFEVGETDEFTVPWFFARQAPWEVEQLACVFDFLQEKLGQWSDDFAFHDVEFCERAEFHLSRSENENQIKEDWMSEGIEFIYALMDEPYEVRRGMLRGRGEGGSIVLFGPVVWYVPDPREDDYMSVLLDLRNTYKDDWGYRAWGVNHQDLKPYCKVGDKGPFEGWCAVHPVGGHGMHHKDAWHRARAYVFWDWDRVKEHELAEKFKAVKDGRRPEPTKKEVEEWNESVRERRRIYQQGGRGYWRKGDLSRVAWSRDDPNWW